MHEVFMFEVQKDQKKAGLPKEHFMHEVLIKTIMEGDCQRETSCMKFWLKLYDYDLLRGNFMHEVFMFEVQKINQSGIAKGKLHAWSFD